MPINLDVLAINVLLSTIIVAPMLWIAGRMVVGREKAKFVDAVLITVLGTVLGAILGAFTTGIIALAIQLIAWLGLIRHYFDCGWGTAFGIAILAIIVFFVISLILGLVGLVLFTTLFI